MVRRTSFQTAECPVARSLEVVGDCWSLLIVRDAGSGLRRFNEFEKSLGIAKNILATQSSVLSRARNHENRARIGRECLPRICSHIQGRGIISAIGCAPAMGRRILPDPT